MLATKAPRKRGGLRTGIKNPEITAPMVQPGSPLPDGITLDDTRDAITVRQAAAMLSVSDKVVYTLISKAELPAFALPGIGAFRVPRRCVMDYLARGFAVAASAAKVRSTRRARVIDDSESQK